MLRLDQREHDLVSFDAGNFKALRAQELRMAAETAAEKVLRTGVPYAFPADEQPRAAPAPHVVSVPLKASKPPAPAKARIGSSPSIPPARLICRSRRRFDHEVSSGVDSAFRASGAPQRVCHNTRNESPSLPVPFRSVGVRVPCAKAPRPHRSGWLRPGRLEPDGHAGAAAVAAGRGARHHHGHGQRLARRGNAAHPAHA